MLSFDDFANYYVEEYGRETIRSEYGFITYFIDGRELFVSDLYVVPRERGSGEATRLFEKLENVAREAECSMISCLLTPTNSKSSTVKLRAFLSVGFELEDIKNDCAIFTKRLKGDK